MGGETGALAAGGLAVGGAMSDRRRSTGVRIVAMLGIAPSLEGSSWTRLI